MSRITFEETQQLAKHYGFSVERKEGQRKVTINHGRHSETLCTDVQEAHCMLTILNETDERLKTALKEVMGSPSGLTNLAWVISQSLEYNGTRQGETPLYFAALNHCKTDGPNPCAHLKF